ncbi:hypothetical protein [Romboutsia ilealis]|uniref:hypothetical protein n=1 Tax=Romboutsia ilealis TaxID=1115758 RepID=UPI00257293F0|nr:hypothetical protein [Romboutsia ilealis]MCI8471137.1 hypothetical protein [Clostridia bacterium]
MKKFKIKNEKLLFTILIIALFIVFLLYYNLVFSVVFARNNFANEMIEISDENENPIFNIQKILLYSSANAIDNSEDQSLKDMSICQYTDISIYLDNTNTSSELTDENTIKQLYIDNIVATSDADIGTKILNYKNPLDFGKYKKIEEAENNRIDFNIINTNSENENNDYANPTFYTDCSNPISLGYMNKDILTNYAVSEDANTISFNGKVLQEANINLEDINYTLSFKIHIINNLNQKFVYNMKLNVHLDDDNGGIYNGYVYKGKTVSGNEYQFFKEI